MARKPGTRAGAEFVLFDVLYEDGSQRSNRRVPSVVLGAQRAVVPIPISSPSRAELSQRSPGSPRSL
jgi:hypothetical protein